MARRKYPGRGEGFSGLRFDLIEETGLVPQSSRPGRFGKARFDQDDQYVD
jgi:hypothetical protein